MATELREGAVVGDRFRLEHLLGKGGMGQVWAAKHEVTGASHALKFLNVSHASRAARRRFEREARAASMVDHPGVIHVHDVFELEDGSQVMVMDQLVGETLRDRLEREEVLSVDDALPILVEIAEIVGATHEAGIVHRDLKPENVFLETRDSLPFSVKVLDFGIAKLRDKSPGDASSTVTEEGQVVGTPVYMAIEQCTGEADVDHRADIWAIGVMAYEMLTGGRPVEAHSVGDAVAKIIDAGIAPLAAVAPDVPPHIAALVDRMLSRDREDRPQSLAEVTDVLTRASTAPTEARIPEARGSARVWVFAGLAAALLGGIWVLWGGDSDESAPRRADRAEEAVLRESESEPEPESESESEPEPEPNAPSPPPLRAKPSVAVTPKSAPPRPSAPTPASSMEGLIIDPP